MLDPGASLFARTRRGDKLYKQGQQTEARKEYEKALELYDQALSQDPSDPAYNLGARRMRFQVSQIHVEAGKKLREKGSIDEALVEFQRAFAVDPSNALALQEIQRTSDMIERNRKGNVKPGEQNLTPAEQAQKQTIERISSMQPIPELKPITNRISTLKMNNQPPKVLYETVGKLAGINVIFDPQMQAPARNVNLDISNTTLEEALDYIGVLTKTFWKPVTSNAIFVTEDNVTKRRDYEDQEVKVFYLKNVTSVQEFQEIVTAVRSITDIRRMFTYNAQNAVMARGTPDQIALAEKLFHDLDKPKAEVVVDIVVMEANTSRTRDIAAGLVSGSTTGLVLPIGFSPRNPILTGQHETTTNNNTTTTTTTTTNQNTTTTPSTTTNPLGSFLGTTTGTTTPTTSQISLAQIGKIGFNDFSVSLPGALLQAVMTDNTTRVLQSPQVRASDGQKVTLKIGDKVPYATGSFQPGFAGSVGGVSPLVSTQFNFAEVGVNVDITPHVHGSDEVTLHVVIEISNVSRQVDIGGLQQPVISQRKNEADIRIRDGEVNLLGGLTQLQDTRSLSGIPGLTNVPILGRLFGSSTNDKERGELMIALIPHIVRTPNITPVDMRGVAAGTEQVVKVTTRPEEAAPAPAPSAPAPNPAATVPPVTPVPAQTAPAQPSVTPTGPPAVTFTPPNTQAALSEPVVVSLDAQNVTDLFAASPIRLKWDPKVLRLVQIAPGAFLKQDGQNPPIIDIRNDTGEATISVSRVTGSQGATGTGSLAQLTFMAIGKGTAAVTVTEASLKNSTQQPIAVAPPAFTVTVH